MAQVRVAIFVRHRFVAHWFVWPRAPRPRTVAIETEPECTTKPGTGGETKSPASETAKIANLSANLSTMTNDRQEPIYLYSENQVAEKSAIARHFLDIRNRLNANVDHADNFLVKRYCNLDHNTYLEGTVPAKYKELMGLVASAVLRCDDCINYHVIQSYRLGATRAEQEETINVALIVGGSIMIPHLRRAYALLTELYG